MLSHESDTERRLPERKSSVCRVEVQELDAGAPVTSQAGLQEDTSPYGAGIRVRKPIPVGQPVKVRHSRGTAIGVVQRCQHQSPEYFVGIQYDHHGNPPGKS